MSPEQATGASAIDARTDIYALGTVLYEMLAGEPPITGETATAVMVRRSAMPAPALRTLRPGIPTALEAAVARALEREPVDRYNTAGEFADALEAALGAPALSEASQENAGVIEREPKSVDVARDQPVVLGATPAGSARATPESRRRWRVSAVRVLAIPVILGIVWLLWSQIRGSPPTEHRVVVTVFENRTGDTTLDQIGIEVADYTRTALKKTGLIDVVAPSFDLWSLQNARPKRPQDLKALARQTQATIIVLGSYEREGDSLVFIGEGRDARSGQVLFAFDSVRAQVSERRQMVEQVRQHVMSAIATGVDPALTPWAGNKSAPPVRFDAYQEFADGMTSFVQGLVSRRGSSAFLTHFASAQAHLGRAFQLDSTYYIAAVWWIFARFNVGDAQGADTLIKALARHRGSMSEYERVLYDYVDANSHGRPEKRYQLDKELVKFGPASEYRFCLIRDAVEAGHPREALKESEALDDSYSWMHLMRGIPSFRVRALVQLEQFGRAIAVAQQARKDLPDDLSPRYPEIDALAGLRRFDEIERVVDTSAAAPGVSDSDGANLMLYAGLRLESIGRPERARRLFARALDAYTSESPVTAAPALILFGKARARYYLGQWDDARVLFDTLTMVQPGTTRYDKQAVLYLASLAARHGDTAEVSRLRYRLAGSVPKDGETEYFEARVAALLGQEARALEFLSAAVERGVGTSDIVEEGGPTPSIDPDFAGLRDLQKFQRIVARW
jgi:tetratricopeptide (TPR) repeat protein